MPTFVLNDQNAVNSYGFRINTDGINIERFTANPVMLDSHNNSLLSVLGRWINIKKQNGQLLADDDFDVADPNVKPIKDKVDRGFIKGVSMGILFDRESISLGADKIPVLNLTEVMEASICAVPSSASSLRLYNKDRQLMSEAELRLNLSAIRPGSFNTNISTPISTLTNPTPGKFSHIVSREDFKKLSNADMLEFKINHYEAYLSLWGVSKKSDVNAIIKTQMDFSSSRMNSKLSGQPIQYTPEQVKTKDDFMKLSTAEQVHFKNNHNGAYSALWAKSSH